MQISAFLHHKYCFNVREGFVGTSFSLKCFSFLNISLSDSPSLHFSCTPTQQKHIRKGVNWPISVDAEKTSTEEPVWRFSQRLFQMSWMKRPLSLWILTGLKTNVFKIPFQLRLQTPEDQRLVQKYSFLCRKSLRGGLAGTHFCNCDNLIQKKRLPASRPVMIHHPLHWLPCFCSSGLGAVAHLEDQNMLSNKAESKWRCLLDMFCSAGTQTFPSSEGFHREVCSCIIYSLIYTGDIQNSLCKENLWLQHVNKMKQEL